MSCPIGMQLRMYNNWYDKASMPSYNDRIMVGKIPQERKHNIVTEIDFFIFLWQEENFESILLRALERFQTM